MGFVFSTASGVFLLFVAILSASAVKAFENHVLRLDGRTGFITVNDNSSLHSLSNAMTLELLVKPTALALAQGEVNSLLRKNTQAGSENFFLRLRNNPEQLIVEVSGGKEIGILRAPCSMQPEHWYHLAATYDGKRLTLFANGKELASEPLSGFLKIDSSPLLIGRGDPDYSGGEFFSGELDEIRIWRIPRTPEDIRRDSTNRLSGAEPGLIAYWNFENAAEDLSAHGNRAVLTAGATLVTSPIPQPLGTITESRVFPGHAAPGTSQDRERVIEDLWQHLNDIYPALEYKGISGHAWVEPFIARARQLTNDIEFHQLLIELMASLQDTHTRIVSYPGQTELQRPPVLLNLIEGKITVTRAETGLGLSAGDVLQAINGKPAEECLEAELKYICNSTARGRMREACEKLLRGLPGTTVSITVAAANGKPRRVQLKRESDPQFWDEPTIAWHKLAQSVCYIRISRWGGGKLISDFDRALEEFSACAGLVIDVRGNGGGSDQLADAVNGRLTEKPVVSSIDFWREPGTDQYHRTIGWVQPRAPWIYRGRVAVLIDEGCASACEHFVSGIEATRRILLAGTPTDGAGGGPTSVTLCDGTQVRISRALGIRSNGVVFEGHGIPPHLEVMPTLHDVRTGTDRTLELAAEWLLSNRPLPPHSQELP